MGMAMLVAGILYGKGVRKAPPCAKCATHECPTTTDEWREIRAAQEASRQIGVR